MRSFILNAEYATTFGAYWMVYGIIGSFASVFMLAKGYDNMHIGMTLAAANLLAFVMQPFIADRMDIGDKGGHARRIRFPICYGFRSFPAAGR